MRRLGFILSFLCATISHEAFSEELATLELQRYSDLERRPIHELKNVELADYLQLRTRALLSDPKRPHPRDEAGTYAKRALYQPFRLNAIQFDLAESDCVSFVVRTLALSLANDWESYYILTERMRHLDGVVEYQNRTFRTLADWLPNNAWLLDDVTSRLGPEANRPAQPFTHVVRPKVFEKSPTGRTVFKGSDYKSGIKEIKTDSYIPSNRIEEVLSDLRTGDVVLVLRSSAGGHLGCDHLAMVSNEGGVIHLIHSAPKAVRHEPISTFLARCYWVQGFKFLRLKEDANVLAAKEVARLRAQISVPAPAAQDEKNARWHAALRGNK